MANKTKDPFIQIRDNLRKAELKQYSSKELILELNRRGYKVSIKGEHSEVECGQLQRVSD